MALKPVTIKFLKTNHIFLLNTEKDWTYVFLKINYIFLSNTGKGRTDVR